MIDKDCLEFIYLLESLILRTEDSADLVQTEAKRVLTIMAEKYTSLKKIAFYMNPGHRNLLIQFLDRWYNNR